MEENKQQQHPQKIQIQKNIILSNEQIKALELFEKGNNIFLTGPGGSGKTELIKRIVEIANKKNRKIQVCALTGCAAILLGCKGSKTIHSWAGVGLASGALGTVVDRVVKNKFKSSVWKIVDVLVIDEVSMMSKKLFDILDSIGRRARCQPFKPFGGIQIVFSGDFYQLPPVGDNDDEDTSAFCFESERWKDAFGKENMIELKTIFRQTDINYTNVLNQIRVGKLFKSSYELVMKRVGLKYPDTCIKPTILVPRRCDAERINSVELAKLTGDESIFRLSVDDTSSLSAATASAANDKKNKKIIMTEEQKEMELRQLRGSIIADDTLVLKIGTQVMCIANLDVDSPTPIVNGSQGVIVDIVSGVPKVKFLNGGEPRFIHYHKWTCENNPDIGIKQIPLIHAWSITIHKSQGVTLEMAEIDAGSNIFECGQTYVALSRVKSLDGLYLTAFNPQKIKTNEKVKSFYNSISV
jgi:ATP-dependent DNA helicase PIF1